MGEGRASGWIQLPLWTSLEPGACRLHGARQGSTAILVKRAQRAESQPASLTMGEILEKGSQASARAAEESTGCQEEGREVKSEPLSPGESGLKPGTFDRQLQREPSWISKPTS